METIHTGIRKVGIVVGTSILAILGIYAFAGLTTLAGLVLGFLVVSPGFLVSAIVLVALYFFWHQIN